MTLKRAAFGHRTKIIFGINKKARTGRAFFACVFIDQ
jgi:hypothetical protein